MLHFLVVYLGCSVKRWVGSFQLLGNLQFAKLFLAMRKKPSKITSPINLNSLPQILSGPPAFPSFTQRLKHVLSISMFTSSEPSDGVTIDVR